MQVAAPAHGRLWHECDIARSQMDVRFRGKSGRAADIARMTKFDPNRSSRANFAAMDSTAFHRPLTSDDAQLADRGNRALVSRASTLRVHCASYRRLSRK